MVELCSWYIWTVFEVEKLHLKKNTFIVKSALIVPYEKFAKVSVIVDVLQPFRVAVKSLCQHDSNLITADVAIEFLLNKIDD